jgi:hypothetical protein
MNFHRYFLSALAAAPIAIGLCATGCGSSSDSGDPAGSGTSPTGSGGAASQGRGGSAGFLDLDAGPSGDQQDPSVDSACATETIEGSLMPLAMYVLLDRSGSMKDDDKWQNASEAFAGFVNGPNAAGIRVALSFFPSADGQCDGAGYDTPAVAMAELPGGAASITASLPSHAPGSGSGQGTPMEGALHGLKLFCAEYAKAHPEEKTVGVLITDGDPNGCDEDSDHLAAIAAASNGGSPAVPVFAIGMAGASFDFLDQVATSGGSSKAFDVSQGGAQAFLSALQAIAGKAIPCEIPMPTSQKGAVDPNKVNVKYTDGNHVEHTLMQVPGASACVADAWYYDDPAHPTKVVLCPDTCSAVRAGSSGKLDVVLGCGTVIANPA